MMSTECTISASKKSYITEWHKFLKFLKLTHTNSLSLSCLTKSMAYSWDKYNSRILLIVELGYIAVPIQLKITEKNVLHRQVITFIVSVTSVKIDIFYYFSKIFM